MWLGDYIDFEVGNSPKSLDLKIMKTQGYARAVVLHSTKFSVACVDESENSVLREIVHKNLKFQILVIFRTWKKRANKFFYR